MNYNYSDFHYPSSSYLSHPPQPLQQVLALPPPPQPPPATDFLTSGLTQKQRKKRTKLVPVLYSPGASTSSSVPKRKYTKPDPAAPKITKPCTECGKTFWSWKALFGHMRCHPERHWRGINPPPNVKRFEMIEAVPVPDCSTSVSGIEMTEEDHEVAAILLLLASGGHAVQFPTPEALLLHDTEQSAYDSAIIFRDAEGTANCRFECSCCKKVFNSHQALGGHRASHKNVKGCFANTKIEGDEEGHNAASKEGECSIRGYSAEPSPSSSSMALVIRHSCSICAKVFSTGQALGGHMRCHWEKSDEPQSVPVSPQPLAHNNTSRHELDLNTPAPFDNDLSSGNSSGLRLDLRLGL